MKRLRHQRGFLLLEVLVAVALVGISLFVLVEGLERCLAAARSIQSYSLADTLLANKSYEFRVERAQDLQDEDGRFDDYAGYSWKRHLELTQTDHLWLQTLTVSWMERSRVATESVSEYRYLPDKTQ